MRRRHVFALKELTVPSDQRLGVLQEVVDVVVLREESRSEGGFDQAAEVQARPAVPT